MCLLGDVFQYRLISDCVGVFAQNFSIWCVGTHGWSFSFRLVISDVFETVDCTSRRSFSCVGLLHILVKDDLDLEFCRLQTFCKLPQASHEEN